MVIHRDRIPIVVEGITGKYLVKGFEMKTAKQAILKDLNEKWAAERAQFFADKMNQDRLRLFEREAETLIGVALNRLLGYRFTDLVSKILILGTELRQGEEIGRVHSVIIQFKNGHVIQPDYAIGIGRDNAVYFKAYNGSYYFQSDSLENTGWKVRRGDNLWTDLNFTSALYMALFGRWVPEPSVVSAYFNQYGG